MQNLFLDISFPYKICLFQRSCLEFFTVVQKAKNGSESRVILNNIGSVKYSYEGGVMKKNDIETLMTFFKITKGRGHSFRFFDIFDNEAHFQELEHIEGSLFQLVKIYQFSGYTVSKLITKPIYGTVKLELKDGTVLIENQDYMIEYFSGNVTIINKNLDFKDIKASFKFDIEARFEHDEFRVSQDKFGNMILNELIITEIL